jgi:hypothetical protein
VYWKRLAARTLRRAERLLGRDINKLSLGSALGRCKRRGAEVRSVIDVGASTGTWTLECQRFFPEAAYLLIEAQQAHAAALSALRRRQKRLDYVIAAAGATGGETYFDATNLYGGRLLESDAGAAASWFQ